MMMKKKLMLDCREVARLISDRQDRRLAPAERARFRLHLVMCRNCRTVEEQMAFLHQAMRRLSEAHEQGSDPVPLSEPRSTS